MEKPILIISSIILLVILYFYSDFDNKNYAYGIIFLCLIAISFSYAKIKNPTDSKDEYEQVEAENDKLEHFDRIFEFKKDGFYVKINKTNEFIKWDEIIEVNSFRIPYLKNSIKTGYEIITQNKSYEFDDQKTAGIYKLGNELSANLSDWKVDATRIRVNNFGLEKANLYRKKRLLLT